MAIKSIPRNNENGSREKALFFLVVIRANRSRVWGAADVCRVILASELESVFVPLEQSAREVIDRLNAFVDKNLVGRFEGSALAAVHKVGRRLQHTSRLTVEDSGLVARHRRHLILKVGVCLHSPDPVHRIHSKLEHSLEVRLQRVDGPEERHAYRVLRVALLVVLRLPNIHEDSLTRRHHPHGLFRQNTLDFLLRQFHPLVPPLHGRNSTSSTCR
mmetsp:Transcript_31210/g.55919  ORF Transcript_31210/g.55919 Transcript_31210/m.55919 type:complete len:216 (+) Transcript_31210:151-798(+)